MPYNIVIAYLVDVVPALHHLALNEYFCLGKLVIVGFYIAIFRKVKKQKQQIGQYGNALQGTSSHGMQIVTPENQTASNSMALKFPSAAGPSTSLNATTSLGGLNTVSGVISGAGMGGESGITGSTDMVSLEATTSRGGPSASHARSDESARVTINVSTSNTEAKLAKMTAATLGCFFALYCPYLMIFWCEKYFEKGSLTFAVLRNIAIEFIALSSAINPFIYGFMNSNFRRAFSKMFKCNKT
ncbi:uncharacterized protein LOC106154326 [Lingula anatina]|uniref:Uncharacterized protein LOC106154326 n=1 Tax=Lingula anatina TaxID=7574 RepID=A0A1S3HDI8_LINAN|nr:uncharacterized protein LOC106154326 [Lingula anatina]|eukprot:XP_013384098.1 uncharacterized protein LOC106154326 [Lingula anatina]